MELDYDLRLRLAVFEHVDRLRRAGGGVVASQQLNEGLRFEGRRVPIWNQQKGIFRPAVLRRSGVALTVQTSFRSPYDDRTDAGDDHWALFSGPMARTWTETYSTEPCGRRSWTGRPNRGLCIIVIRHLYIPRELPCTLRVHCFRMPR